MDDPVALAAPVAYRLAHAHCRSDPSSGESCAWYHGARLYIRALGTGQCSIPASHAAFFTTAFAAHAPDPRFASILLAGSADYAMPSLIVAAYAGAAQRPRLSVVDICATPLKLIEWYAARSGFAVDLHESDILDYAADAPFDILATHHLFNYFAPPARAALVAQWHQLLRRGGKLIVVSRFRAAPASSRSPASAPRQAFTDGLIAAARAAAPRLDLPEAELIDMIRAYRAQIRAHCLDSADELRPLLDGAGFAIERYERLAQRRGASDREETADAIGVVAKRL